MHAEISFIGLFWQASLLVKLVMMTLMGMSVVSWALIIQRGQFAIADDQCERPKYVHWISPVIKSALYHSWRTAAIGATQKKGPRF